MQVESSPWVQRLRDGVIPPLRPFVLGAVGLLALSVGVLVFEALHADAIASVGRVSVVVIVPLLGAVFCVVVPISAWRDTRQDRRALAHAHRHGQPAFHLPVSARGISAPQDLPDRRITLFTVDGSGLLGWTAVSPDPVMTIPWSSIERIDLATKDDRGRRVDYGLWLTTTDGAVVLQPRSALGRPFEAGQPKLDTLRRVLRSLRP
ncbi:hypothetical protein [Curtobacterium sp. ME26]|uniref:hypothetical protein n=1 Tax=Curtobacterium sp. ME26 TaxID=2744254 RepID=UPI0015F42DCC|nr:hypothetical protein [Curtobacterium sp. ME26]